MLSDSNPLVNKIRYYFGFGMVALYLVIGLLFLFSDIAIQTFPLYRTGVGILFIIYAGFRLFVTIRKQRQEKQNE